ncbi:MAG: c-type cytochrome [Ignavibacteria bacterium]
MTRTALALACLALAACEKGMHDMYDQPRYKTFAPSPLFGDGSSARTPPPGTRAFADGPFAGTSSARAGADHALREQQALDAQTIPAPLTRATLDRGRDRFGIYCVPCHGPVGDGDGLVARRGFPHPPSYHIDRLRTAPDRHLFDVISDGYGLMPRYGNLLSPTDRWAVVAYIRALQLSQQANVRDLPQAARRRLEAVE